jgi:hypothetical protein
MANNLYKTFTADSQLEKQGIWLDFGGPRFRVLRSGPTNKKFLQVLSEKQRPVAAQIRAGVLSEDHSRRILAEVYADSIITDWEDVKDADGVILDFSRENVIKVLCDLPDLFTIIQDFSSNIANFRHVAIEEEGKN